jgi:hypothetical protein
LAYSGLIPGQEACHKIILAGCHNLEVTESAFGRNEGWRLRLAVAARTSQFEANIVFGLK